MSGKVAAVQDANDKCNERSVPRGAGGGADNSKSATLFLRTSTHTTTAFTSVTTSRLT